MTLIAELENDICDRVKERFVIEYENDSRVFVTCQSITENDVSEPENNSNRCLSYAGSSKKGKTNS